MTNHTVYLGWCRLLETNPDGLAALHGLCGALEVRTHWAPDRQALYLESPVQGRTVWLEASEGPPPAGLSGVLAHAARALEAAGARVVTPGGDPGGRASQLRGACPDLLVHLAAGGGDALEAVFSTTVPGRSRLLARTLLAAAAAATGLPERGVQFRWPRAPLAAALAGVDCPAASLVVPEGGGGSAGALAQAIWEALMRFLAQPELAELLDRLALRRAPAVTAGFELPPVAGGEEIDAPSRPPDGESAHRAIPGAAPAAPPPSGAPVAPSAASAEPAGLGAAPAAGRNPFRPPGARHVYMFRVLSGGRAAFSLQPGPPARATAGPGPTSAPVPAADLPPASHPIPASEGAPAPGSTPASGSVSDPATMPPSPLVSARPAPPVVSFRPSPGPAPPPGGRFPARPGRAVPLQGPVRRRRGHWQSSGPPR